MYPTEQQIERWIKERRKRNNNLLRTIGIIVSAVLIIGMPIISVLLHTVLPDEITYEMTSKKNFLCVTPLGITLTMIWFGLFVFIVFCIETREK